MSMSDVPKDSVLANRLGKTGKSTAKMLEQVMIIIAPRYAVMKGLTGSGSLSSLTSSSFDADDLPSVSGLRGVFVAF